MKCIECGIETGFEWPIGEDPSLRTVWKKYYEGPVCKSCSGDAPLRSLLDTQEPSQQFCFALRCRESVEGVILDFQDLIESPGPGNLPSPSLDDVEDL
jgi:hypothetical protein